MLKFQRKTLMPVFQQRHFDDWKPITSSRAEEFSGILMLHYLSSPKKSGSVVVDISTWANRFAFDVGGILGTGCDFGALHADNSGIFAAYEEIFASSRSKKKQYLWHNLAPS
jgi:hypothetical protein